MSQAAARFSILQKGQVAASSLILTSRRIFSGILCLGQVIIRASRHFRVNLTGVGSIHHQAIALISARSLLTLAKKDEETPTISGRVRKSHPFGLRSEQVPEHRAVTRQKKAGE